MFERELSNASRKAELFANLLNSIESEYGGQLESFSDSFKKAKFDEWKKVGPVWEKLVTCQALILMNRINSRQGEWKIDPDSPFFSKIRNEVWTHFKNLSPEEIKDINEKNVTDEFEKAVSSSPELAEELKKMFLKCLREPFQNRENIFRRVVGLNQLHGGEDYYGEI